MFLVEREIMERKRKPGAGRKPSKPDYDANEILSRQMEAAVALYSTDDHPTLQAIWRMRRRSLWRMWRRMRVLKNTADENMLSRKLFSHRLSHPSRYTLPLLRRAVTIQDAAHNSRSKVDTHILLSCCIWDKRRSSSCLCGYAPWLQISGYGM